MKRHGKALNADYYDREWKQQIRAREKAGMTWSEREEARFRASAAHVVGSVLDLGCGDGTLAKFVKGPYLGVDFSPLVIKEARRLHAGPQTRFLIADILDLPALVPVDTVAMLETLEHLDEPAEVIESVRPLARKRIVISVPVRSYSDSDCVSHIWPAWSEDDVKQLLGAGAICQTFRRWRIGVWKAQGG